MKNVQTNLDLAKEYILLDGEIRKFEAVLATHHIGLTYNGLLKKKKELKNMTGRLSKIDSTLLTREVISCKKDHFKVLSQCKLMVSEVS